MTLDKIVVSIFGLAGIAFTYWFFLMREEKEVEVVGSIDIIAEGGYSPEVISIPVGKTTKLNFLRKDGTDCMGEVILSDFRIRKSLPVNRKVTIEVRPKSPGEYVYACGMNMYHGKIIAK